MDLLGHTRGEYTPNGDWFSRETAQITMRDHGDCALIVTSLHPHQENPVEWLFYRVSSFFTESSHAREENRMPVFSASLTVFYDVILS